MTGHDVVVVGADIAGFPTLDGELTSAVFDDDADTWTLTTSDGQTCHARVVITANPPVVPWIPNLPGTNDFRGPAFHAATPECDFDPAGRRVAVIGTDTSAGQLIGRLTPSAASVTVFPHQPRRVVPDTRRRWRRRKPSAGVIAEPIDSLTASGIRSCDGTHHDVDAIIYGTGYTVTQDTLVGSGGVTIQQAWSDGMEPYLGVAIHGFPNYFLITGPDTARYVAGCLQLMNGYSRIEVRRSSQQTYNERVYLRRPKRGVMASAFELSSGATRRNETYDGAATLTTADISQQVRVHLTGHLNPIDGQYHWQGTVFDTLPAALLKQNRAVTLAIGSGSASARITEETPQGTYSITGVGTPPFALAGV